MTVTAKPIKLKTASGKTITLNDQQVGALSGLKEWLHIPGEEDDLFATLSGYAGTGKTTITKELIRYYKKDKAFQWNGIAVSAPTHKAKKVIRRHTDETAYTIQGLLGLRPNTDLENFDINNPQFDPKAKKEICFYKFIIIDEASMLNESLYDLMVAEAKKFRVKVLFMGDEGQLPPVNESISKVFTDVKHQFRLTKVERQSDGNPLMKVYDMIRSDFKSPFDLFSHDTEVNDKGEGIAFHTDIREFDKEVLALFASDEFRNNSDFIKMLAYTNDSVQAWNKRIRDYIFTHSNEPSYLVDLSKPVLPGDILFAYKSATGEREEILIENSSDYRVMGMNEAVSAFGVDIYEVTLKSVDEGLFSRVQIVRASGVDKFSKIWRDKHDAAVRMKPGRDKSFAWKHYYLFKDSHLLLHDVNGAGGMLLVKKDLDYGYAITIHKSQGSTYTNVAVSEKNTDINKKNEERNKLKYVAFSRPTQKAIIYTNKTK